MSCTKLKIFFLIFSFFLAACTPSKEVERKTPADTLVIGVKALPTNSQISRLLKRKLSRVNERFEMVPDALDAEVPGAFEVETQTPQLLRLKNRHPAEMPPAVEFVEFRVMQDDNVRALALKNHQVDAVQNEAGQVLPEIFETALRQDPHVQFQSTEGSQVIYLAFNTQNQNNPWLSKIEVRKALAYVLDPATFVAYEKSLKPAVTLLPVSHWAYEKDVTLYHQPHKKNSENNLGNSNIKVAQDLLSQVLARSDDPIRRLTLTLDVLPREMGMARWIAKNLSTLGIDLKVMTVTGTADVAALKKTYQMKLMTTPEDPEALSEPVFLSELYHSDAYDQLSASLTQATSQTQGDQSRQEVYSWMQKILSQDLPVIPLWYVQNRIVYQDVLENVRLRPDGSYDWILDVKKRSVEP